MRKIIVAKDIHNMLFQDGFPLWKRVLAGLSAGGIGQLIASPADLVKTQIQMEGKRRLQGKPARVQGTWDAVR